MKKFLVSILLVLLTTNAIADDRLMSIIIGSGTGIAIGNQFKHHKNGARIVGGIVGAMIGDKLYQNSRTTTDTIFIHEPRVVCYKERRKYYIKYQDRYGYFHTIPKFKEVQVCEER